MLSWSLILELKKSPDIISSKAGCEIFLYTELYCALTQLSWACIVLLVLSELASERSKEKMKHTKHLSDGHWQFYWFWQMYMKIEDVLFTDTPLFWQWTANHIRNFVVHIENGIYVYVEYDIIFLNGLKLLKNHTSFCMGNGTSWSNGECSSLMTECLQSQW